VKSGGAVETAGGVKLKKLVEKVEGGFCRWRAVSANEEVRETRG
jgi:hypothetical protein